MKIAIVAPSPVPYTVGGAEKLWWGLLDAFRRYSDHEVELLKFPTREGSFSELLDAYDFYARLDLNHFDLVISTKYPAWMVWHDNHWVYLQHKLRGLYDTYPAAMPVAVEEWPSELAGLRVQLEQPARRQRRDALFAELKRLRVELSQQQWQAWFALPSPLVREIIHWLDATALRPGMIKKFMAISENVRGRQDYFPANVPVQVIHHPSDLLPALSSGNDYLFTASRLDAPKRIDLLIRAMRASSANIDLLIAGSGPQQAELQALAEGDERIRFLGRIADAELRRYYGGALAVPFLPADEDYGLITVEAMQAGKPVLTCADTGGVTELVEHGVSGWVVAPEAAAIAEAIEQIAAEPEASIAMAANCQARVAHINWRQTLAAIMDPGPCLDASGFIEQGKPRRILVPLTFPVWPPRGGGQLRVFHIYRRIAKYTPVTLLTLCNSEQPGFDGEIAPGLRELRIPKSAEHHQGEREAERALNASVADLYAIEHMSQTPLYMQALRQLADASDLVIASHPYLYRAIRQVYRGYVYYEAHNVELDLKRDILAHSPGAAPWLQLIEAVEGQCARESLGVSACSTEDAARLAQLYELAPDSIEIAPNGVASGEIPHIPPVERARVARRLLGEVPAAVVFMGSWHGPNIEAVSWIIEQLAPQLPQLAFWVVGSVGNYWKKDRNKMVPENVILMGQLDEADKNAVLSCAQVAINPVNSGSGSNLKMAEYAASGLSVLTTPFGCRGFELDGLHLVQVAELEDFAERLVRLLDSPAMNSPIEEGRADREIIAANHDWNDIADAYFAHLVSVYARSVYNRRQDTAGACLE